MDILSQQAEASLKSHVAMEAASRQHRNGENPGVMSQAQPSEQSDYSVMHDLEDLARKYADSSHEARTMKAAVRALAKNMRAAEQAAATASRAARDVAALADQIRLARFALGVSS